ncbi:MAG TPA: ACP S-malonyltransferase [Victivallales bacterium]|nr:ACP S-malonyltransferase [Victivallales bacterium]
MKFAFVFSGQGAQSVGMGKDVAELFPAAKNLFNNADSILGWKLSELCFAGPEEKLTQSKFCQPSIFTVSCACLEAFKSSFPEIKPVAVAGLSLGEFSSLYCSGVFSFEDGLKLVAKRGELMDQACMETKGAMASVLGADQALVSKACSEAGIDMANLNCPGQIVVSGQDTKVAEAIEKMKGLGIRKIIPLKVAGAYHSRLMDGAAKKFAEELAKSSFSTPKIPVAQNVVGKIVSSVEEIKTNLAKQVSGSVLWEKCVLSMCEIGAEALIEFGPGNVLAGLAKRIKPELKTFNINSAKSVEEFKNFINN